jgi:hypothetical protein
VNVYKSRPSQPGAVGLGSRWKNIDEASEVMMWERIFITLGVAAWPGMVKMGAE